MIKSNIMNIFCAKKMNYIVIILILFSISILTAKTFDETDYKIYNSQNGNEISMKNMAKDLSDYDVIFFGEWHDDILIHKLEADILPLLNKKSSFFSKKRNMAVSMEMFERDVQQYLNQFLNSEISEEEFLKNTRAWGNYPNDYRPIIEYAKQNKLDVIAANVPRRYASLLNKKGIQAIENLPENEKKYVAKKILPLENQYKKQFIETMSNNMGRKNAMGMKKMLENIYAAQCLKDDTMAESMYEYLLQNPDSRIIHYNGNFHSESHLGTANKLKLLNPDLKIAVISPVIVDKNEEIKFDASKKELGNYLIFAHRFSSSEEKEVAVPKMFKNVSNTILEHKLNLKINPAEKSLNGYDEITLSKNISQKDTIYILSALKIKKISAENQTIKYNIDDSNKEYRAIIFPENIATNKIKIEYGGILYFPLKGRNLNETHDGTMGIISDKEGEGIYLPGANWYPFIGDELADYDITVSCPSEFQLLTSGKESSYQKDKKTIYNWKSELSVDHIYLVGNKFETKSRIVNGVELRTYLLKDDAKFADAYLDGVEKYLTDYSKLFGDYPFSSFSVVENFFASGFGMANFTLLAKEIVKMPFVTLSPGVIAHEFCHNWWGNSVYVDYQNGNWCEAITVFSSNYYQNILKGNIDKASDWRKQSILENNLLPKEKRFPLKDFIYQHNDDEAVIGYQKGAMLFVYLFQIMGEESFFETIKEFYAINKGKVADWNDVKFVFAKHFPSDQNLSVEDIFDYWLNSEELPHIRFDEITFEDGILTYSLVNETSIPIQIPIRITFENGTISENVLVLKQGKTQKSLSVNSKPTKIEIDPNSYVLKTISEQSMPYNLNRTLNGKPLVILPESGELVSRLQMVVSMFSRSGYDIQMKSANEVTEEDLINNSLFILGEYDNNSLLQKFKFPDNISVKKSILEIEGNIVESKKGSMIASFESPYNSDKSVSIYTWNSKDAITSFRKMFHYLNESYQTFDLDIKENGAINSGQIFPKGQNELIYQFE